MSVLSSPVQTQRVQEGGQALHEDEHGHGEEHPDREHDVHDDTAVQVAQSQRAGKDGSRTG